MAEPLSHLGEAALRKLVAVKLDPKFYDPERDGVTYSVLETFRACREKARLGLRGLTSTKVSPSMVFGTIAHAVLQGVYDDLRHRRIPRAIPSPGYVKKVLEATETEWKLENPRAGAETIQNLEFSMALADAVIPRYFKYWADDFAQVRWLEIEKEFRIPVTINVPGFRKVKTFVRGKMDGNYVTTPPPPTPPALWLFETKTKSHITEEIIADLLPHELQVGIYIWAMTHLHKRLPTGVRYNIIRRPGLRQRQAETMVQFAQRCAEDVSIRPDWYFVRLDMEINQKDQDKFKGEFDDLLEDFLGWWYGYHGHYKNSGQCENKYGVCPFLAVCGRKDYIGLYKRETVFRELEEV